MSIRRCGRTLAGFVAVAMAVMTIAACGGRTDAEEDAQRAVVASETVRAVPTEAPTEVPTEAPAETATATPRATATATPEATPTSTPTPPVVVGAGPTPVPAATQPPAPPTQAPAPAPSAASTGSAVAALSLGSARVSGDPIEVRDTVWRGGREHFADPSAPQYIAWYERFGRPGNAGTNSIFAAHINYVGHGNGPFAFLTSAAVGDLLHVAMADGTSYAYSVQSVRVILLSQLDMNQVVYPSIGTGRERVTLISCGGTFVPRPGGGGDYDSRVVVVAERIVS